MSPSGHNQYAHGWGRFGDHHPCFVSIGEFEPELAVDHILIVRLSSTQGREHPAETLNQLPNVSTSQSRILTGSLLQRREPVRRDLSLGLCLSGSTCDSDRISARVERITVPGQLSIEIADEPSRRLELGRSVRLCALHSCQRDLDLLWVEDLG